MDNALTPEELAATPQELLHEAEALLRDGSIKFSAFKLLVTAARRLNRLCGVVSPADIRLMCYYSGHNQVQEEEIVACIHGTKREPDDIAAHQRSSGGHQTSS